MESRWGHTGTAKEIENHWETFKPQALFKWGRADAVQESRQNMEKGYYRGK